MACGGGATGAFRAAKNGKYLEGLKSCGRMVITGNNHKWEMENMPESRLLNDMVILPTGLILIINGTKNGCGGCDNAVTPSFCPYLYNPEGKPRKRFSILKSTKIARMYHSSAILLPDGRVLVAGGNTHSRYTFGNVAYPTELRLQAFVPDHMDQKFDHSRPQNVSIYASNGGEEVGYGEVFAVWFWLGTRADGDGVAFSVYAPPFATHSISMNQRMLILRCTSRVQAEDGWVKALMEVPPLPNIAPPSYYLITVVNGGTPSVSHWVKFIRG